MNKTLLFLALFVTMAGIYYIILVEPVKSPLIGDLQLESKSVELDDNYVEFSIKNPLKSAVLITSVSGDCVIMPPPFPMKKDSSFKLSGECIGSKVNTDLTIDLVVNYKIQGQSGKKQQAIKLYLK
ncbi:MAG: hypothetical protein ABH851_04740 [Methanobacteriota archaeon]